MQHAGVGGCTVSHAIEAHVHSSSAVAQAAINATDAQHDTALHLAARRGHAGVVEALLSRFAQGRRVLLSPPTLFRCSSSSEAAAPHPWTATTGQPFSCCP